MKFIICGFLLLLISSQALCTPGDALTDDLFHPVVTYQYYVGSYPYYVATYPYYYPRQVVTYPDYTFGTEDTNAKGLIAGAPYIGTLGTDSSATGGVDKIDRRAVIFYSGNCPLPFTWKQTRIGWLCSYDNEPSRGFFN